MCIDSGTESVGKPLPFRYHDPKYGISVFTPQSQLFDKISQNDYYICLMWYKIQTILVLLFKNKMMVAYGLIYGKK